MKRLLSFVSYVAMRAGEGLIRLLPMEFAFVLGQIGGEIAYRILWRRRAVALTNLRLAFAREKSEDELRQLNRRHFQLLGANLLAGIKAFRMSPEALWKRVTANIPQERKKSGWVALISHTGNWELYSHLGQCYPEYRFGSVYQPLANPFIDAVVRKARTDAGIALFDRRTQLLACVKFLREGGVVGVLTDQGAGYAGVWMPLFGRLTSCSTLAARLALRADLPLLPIAIATVGRARWELRLADPIFPETDDAELLTAQMNQVLEQQIRQSPADWLWAHNRWKPLRPHILFTRDQRRVFFPPDFDRAGLDPFRILIVAPDSAPDGVATFPAIDAMKTGRPDSDLTVIVAPHAHETWEANRSVSSIIVSDPNESASTLARKIRQSGPFDVAIFLNESARLSFAIFRAGVPLRVGFARGWNSLLCNQHPSPLPTTDIGIVSLHIARSIGANVNVPGLTD